MKRLSMQEFILGTLSTMIFIQKVFWLPALCGILWMLGGAYWNPIRRFGIPIVVAVILKSVYPLIGIAVLHIGDGYPDPFTGDKGSWLGRFVSKYVNDFHTGGFITKLTIPLLLQIAWIPVFVLR